MSLAGHALICRLRILSPGLAPVPSVFHNPAIELAVEAHKISLSKYRKAPNDMLRDAFFVLNHDAICVHRAVGALVDAGWPAPGAALLRTLLDMNASALALANSGAPRLAAFRYLYSGLRRHSRDQVLPSEARRQMYQQIRDRLGQLPKSLRQQAMDVVREKDRPYWFAPEWPNPGSIIQQYGSAKLHWVYMQMSAAAHGTFLGMRLFREDPDSISIDPEEPAGPRGLFLDFASCRFLLEIVRIRGVVEGLNVEPDINALIQKIVTAAAKVPGVRPPPPDTG